MKIVAHADKVQLILYPSRLINDTQILGIYIKNGSRIRIYQEFMFPTDINEMALAIINAMVNNIQSFFEDPRISVTINKGGGV